jgi:hypothetical protein
MITNRYSKSLRVACLLSALTYSYNEDWLLTICLTLFLSFSVFRCQCGKDLAVGLFLLEKMR